MAKKKAAKRAVGKRKSPRPVAVGSDSVRHSDKHGHSFEAEFKTVSGSLERGRVGLVIERNQVGVDDAMDLFINSQIRFAYEYDPNASGDANGQGKLDPSDLVTVDGIGECKSVRISARAYHVGLSFPREQLNADDPLSLSGRKGTFSCTKVGAAISEADDDADGEGDSE